jgi:hypothetical protein
MTSHIITADGTHKDAKPANGKDWQLYELQAIVRGNIEIIGINHPEWPYNTMVLNEEGKLNGLPLNRDATVISGLYPDDVIVGNVLLCNTDDEGNMI